MTVNSAWFLVGSLPGWAIVGLLVVALVQTLKDEPDAERNLDVWVLSFCVAICVLLTIAFATIPWWHDWAA